MGDREALRGIGHLKFTFVDRWGGKIILSLSATPAPLFFSLDVKEWYKVKQLNTKLF